MAIIWQPCLLVDLRQEEFKRVLKFTLDKFFNFPIERFESET